MAKLHVFLFGVVLVCLLALPAPAQTQNLEVSRFSPMRNRDVVMLVRNKIAPDEIITVIKISWCNFDIFPPVLQELKKRGIPEQILHAMVAAPYGPPSSSRTGKPSEAPIYHSAAQLKDMGLITISPIRRTEQMGEFAPDRRGASFSIRQ